jgi:hypothetical protein
MPFGQGHGRQGDDVATAREKSVDRRTSQRIRQGRLAAVLVLAAALGVGACGASASPTAAPPATTAPTPAPTASPTLAPTPTPSPTPTSSPSPTPTPTTTPNASVSVVVEASWQQVAMTEAALTDQMNLVSKSNPQLANTLKQLVDSGAFQHISFYALDFDGARNIGNFNVTSFPTQGTSLAALQPLVEGEYKQLGATSITFSHVTLLATDTLVVDYLLNLNSGGTKVAMTGRSYLVPVGDLFYNVTTTCYGAKIPSCIADGDTMAGTMVIGS